jgi:hypothetical protein
MRTLGLSRLRALRRKGERIAVEVDEAIVVEFERRVYEVQEIADAAGLSRQGVYNVVKRVRERHGD